MGLLPPHSPQTADDLAFHDHGDQKYRCGLEQLPRLRIQARVVTGLAGEDRLFALPGLFYERVPFEWDVELKVGFESLRGHVITSDEPQRCPALVEQVGTYHIGTHSPSHRPRDVPQDLCAIECRGRRLTRAQKKFRLAHPHPRLLK
jgi:hypothetical protein